MPDNNMDGRLRGNMFYLSAMIYCLDKIILVCNQK